MQYKFKDTPHKAQNAFDEGLYSFRKSPNVLDGAYDRLLLNKVVGGTLAVNQYSPELTATNWVNESGVTSSYSNGTVTFSSTTASNGIRSVNILNVISGHKYAVFAKAYATTAYTMRVGSASGINKSVTLTANAWTNIEYVAQGAENNQRYLFAYCTTAYSDVQLKGFVLTDITQLCGSAIADYVYTLEQSTAGSGVAWLKQYYPSIFSSYQPYNAGELMSVEGLESHDTVGFNQFDKTATSYVSGGYRYFDIPIGATQELYISFTDKDTSVDVSDANVGFTIVNAGRVNSYIWNMTAGVIKPNHSNITNGGFAELRGSYCPYLLIYPSTQDVLDRLLARYDICINISSDRNGEYEEYVKHSYPLDNSLTLRGLPKLDSFNNLYYDGDEYEPDGTVTRKYGVRAYQNGDESLADAITDGTNTVYKLTTPTTETADPFTNPQVVYADGTEEFTDFAVASGRRDISLPVQCESMYYEAVPLPAEALSINGKFIEDVIDGYRTLNVSGRETMAQEVKEAEVGKHDGAFFQYRRYPTRDIVVKYQIIAESNEAYRNAFIKLNQMLDFSEGVLIFNDETDKYFVGTPTDVELPEPGLNCAVGEFTLHCEDPFKYSVQEKGVAMQSDANGYFFGLDYKGTHKSYPRIETDFYKTDTEDDSNGECSFISFMKTDGKILLFGDPENTGANRAPVRIFQRASSAPAVPSSQVTFSFESQTVTNPSALGSWSTTIPSGESALWTTMAIAESTATNAYINQADWGTVEQYANQDDSALYSINSKTEVNKKFTSQGTAWASNSGKTYNGWPETGTPGIVTLSGNKYITASGYGSGSNWHGPSVTRTKSDDIRDFLFTFNYAFYQGTGDQASKQTGLLQAVLWNSTQSKIIAALSFWKNSGNSKGSIRMVVGGKSVKTLSEVPFGILTQNACSIKKIGSTVIFNVKGTEYRFVDESIKETATDKITLYFAKKGTTTAMKEIGVHSAQLIKYYQPVSPNPFTSNDELRINTKNTAVQLNGLDAQGLGALANDWEGFYLKPGINLIGVVWSEYVSSAYKPTCRLYYREVYL